MNHNQMQPSYNPHELESKAAARLQRAAEARNVSSAGRLDPGTGRKDFSGSTTIQPLVAHERYSGTYEEGLTHLVLVGGFTLAISRGFNHKRVSNPGTAVESVRVSILPIGDHQATSKQSSITLLEVNPRVLGNPRQDGIVHPSESIKIGRQMLEDATGTSDGFVSREHLEITILEDASIRIHDTSSNGTQVLAEADMMKSEAFGGLADEGKHDMAAILQQLQEHPWEWTEQAAGQTVITDAQ